MDEKIDVYDPELLQNRIGILRCAARARPAPAPPSDPLAPGPASARACRPPAHVPTPPPAARLR